MKWRLAPQPTRAVIATLGLLIVVGALQLAHLQVVALVLVPLAVAICLPIAATLLVRIVIAVGVVYVGNVVIAWVAELVGISFVPLVAVLAFAFPLVVAASVGLIRPRLSPILDGGDVIAVLAGVAVLVFLWLPTARDSSANILARVVSDGEDNAAHLGIVQAIVLQHGLLLGQAKEWSGRLLPGHTAYPPAFHLNVALLLSALQNLFGSSSPALLVRVYFAVVLGLQAIWAATTVLAARALAHLPRTSPLAIAVIAVATIMFFFFGPPSELMNWGFQSQVAALWMLTLELFVATTPELDGHPVLRLSLVLSAMAGTSWSWYLVTPVAGVTALIVTFVDRKRLLPRWPPILAVWIVALALSAPPLVYGIIVRAPSYINANGGVYFLDRVFIALLVVAAFGALLLGPRWRGVVIGVGTLIASGVMAIAIHWYQVHTAGAANYFYEKVLYTIVVVAIVVAAGSALYGLDIAMRGVGVSRWRQLGLAAVLIAIAWLSTGTVTAANPGRNYLTGTRIYPDVGVMQHLLVTPPPGDGRQIIFWGDERHYDYLLSRFVAGIDLRNTDPRNDFIAISLDGQDDQKLLALIRQSPDGLSIMTRDPNLRARLMAAGFTSADLDRVSIDTITEPGDWSVHRPIGVDISPRGLFPSLFRQR